MKSLPRRRLKSPRHTERSATRRRVPSTTHELPRQPHRHGATGDSRTIAPRRWSWCDGPCSNGCVRLFNRSSDPAKETPVHGFDVVGTSPKTWRRGQLRVLVRMVPAVDAAAVEDIVAKAQRLIRDNPREICLFVMGEAVAPVADLGRAIDDLRRRSLQTGVHAHCRTHRHQDLVSARACRCAIHGEGARAASAGRLGTPCPLSKPAICGKRT